MTRQEFDQMTDNYSPLDEIVLMSPGGKELVITGLDADLTFHTGKIVIKTEWLVKPPEKKPIVKHRAKNRTKGPVVRTGKVGRPRRLRDENGEKVERKARKSHPDQKTDQMND